MEDIDFLPKCLFPFSPYKLIFGAFLRQGVKRYTQVFLIHTPKPFSFSTSPGLINQSDKMMSRAFKNQECHVSLLKWNNCVSPLLNRQST